jgi:hypothetical protein
MGGTFIESYSSLTAGQNLADGKSWAMNKSPVRIVGIGLVGGAALDDAHINVYYGQELIADIYSNSADDTFVVAATGEKLWHFISSNKRCRAGDQINIECLAAGAGDYKLFVDIREG